MKVKALKESFSLDLSLLQLWQLHFSDIWRLLPHYMDWTGTCHPYPKPIQTLSQKWAGTVPALSIHSKLARSILSLNFKVQAAVLSTHCFSRSMTILSTSSVEGTCVPWRRLLDVGKNSSPLKREQNGLKVTLDSSTFANFKPNYHSWWAIKHTHYFTHYIH